jgi:hypothetical protein
MAARNKYSPDGKLGVELLFGDDCSPSAEYQAFLQSIGWRVNVRTHTGFLADIDPTAVSCLSQTSLNSFVIYKGRG